MNDATAVEANATTETLWHYVRDEQTQGPIPESEIVSMFNEGRLGPTTPVWSDGMEDWVPASQVPTFQQRLAEVPLVAPQQVPQRTLRDRAEAARAEGVPQVRPWVRYFARITDMYIFAFAFGLFMGYVGLAAEIPEYAFGLMVPFIWIFAESLLLSTFGTTPGKWLLGTWVCDAAGKRLSFSDALSRSFSVWFMGMGLGLPVVTLVTLIASYVKLKKEGMTNWDREGPYAIIHERVGVGRVLAVLALIVIFGAIAAIAQMGDLSTLATQ